MNPNLPRTALLAAMLVACLAACGDRDASEAAAVDAAPATEAAAANVDAGPAVAADPTPAPAPAAAAGAPVAEPAAAEFDINAIPVSDAPLGEWPYIVLPAGYEYDDADDVASRSKDLARVPVWTGGQLLWVEGRTFSDTIENSDGKTYSRFEVRKNLQQAIEALGGVRLAEGVYDEAVYTANEKAIDDFRQEFGRIRDAYWYGNDADTYVIRRADKAIWVVFHSGNSEGGLMVVEGPLPEAPAAQ